MTKIASDHEDRTTNSSIPNKTYHSKQHQRTMISLFSPKLSVYLLATCVTLFILFQIQSLQTPPSSSSAPRHSWPFMHQWKSLTFNNSCTQELKSMATKLRRAVTFVPLKDLRYAQTAQQGHTWFMSSMYDTHEEGEVQYQHFPSEASKGRLLCIRGHDKHDGAWNSYALAWPETLPHNATLMEGLTFVSYNHYNYDNIWHGLSAMVPFVAWHIKNGCPVPTRWILYHWGELRTRVGPWLRSLMEATFSGSPYIEGFDHGEDAGGSANCFEEAVVMRHNEGGMSRERRMEVYDLMRCKARVYCNVSMEGRSAEVKDEIRMTMFMRTGPRSFRNESAVVGIFEKECRKVSGCRLMVAYSNNLTFCQQVKLMSSTDILVSPHGAQLTNMFLMDRNSSVMEFFPKGWLKLAGVGQYVYHWIASWSGMRHQGAWRDPDGDHCPYPDDDRRCMSVYKSGKIGYNQTYFAEWARNVLTEVKMRKIMEEASPAATFTGCGCS
uniref:Glycosyltransferase 61 catalytic domain-containing protein n=1 Tax=Davidia involucrata TaxID=16924 RepID=A0A5B7BU68_DAVIN